MENKHFFYTLTKKWSMIAMSLGIFLALSLFLGTSMNVAYSETTLEYQPTSVRDPFVPLIGEDGKLTVGALPTEALTSNFTLEGIIYDPKGQSVVIIDGEVYNQGDLIQQSTVLTIFKDRVLFIENDQEKTVWLREEILS